MESLLIILIGILGSIAFVQAMRIFELSAILKKVDNGTEHKENIGITKK